MITSFTCDKERACTVAGFAGINKTGKYVGILTQVEVAESKSGATYIEIAFKAVDWATKNDDGSVETCTGSAMCFIRTYITKKNGERSFGRDIIDALMAVLKIDKMDAQPMKVFGRNYKNDKNDCHMGQRLPALEQQRVGLLLQRVNSEYEDSTGKMRPKFDMRIITPYDPNTMQNAAEVLRGSDASAVEQRFKSLHDVDEKPRTQSGSGYQPTAADTATAVDDDPF